MFLKNHIRIQRNEISSIKVFTLILLFGICISNVGECYSQSLSPIPEKLVVLTFDDGCISNTEFVAPLLEEYGFGATFFFTDAFLKDESLKDENYMTWNDALKIHNAGFEIGSHTGNHTVVEGLSASELQKELEYIENRCEEYGIEKPKTFAYPGFYFDLNAVQVLREKGYLFARRGVFPEHRYNWDMGINNEGGRGPVYEPAEDDPLLIPCTGFSGPDWGFEDFLWALEQGGNGKIPILNFHGVPDLDHPWVNTDTEVLKKYMDYLRDNNYQVIAMRDLIKYVDPARYPADSYAPIQRRINRLKN
jgi:peptidoglycan/xylan/chitin deacetylase (PgdA/CDA1 family)